MPDEVKKVKLIISKEKEKGWLEREAECSRTMYKKLQGQLLTTVEIALPPGNQLEALKSRIKSVQGEMWSIIEQTGYTIFEDYFSISDEPQSEKPEGKEYTAKVKANLVNEFWHELCKLIKGNFDNLSRIVVNLATLAMEDIERQQVLKTEIQRLIDHSAYKLQGWLREGITRSFGVK